MSCGSLLLILMVVVLSTTLPLFSCFLHGDQQLARARMNIIDYSNPDDSHPGKRRHHLRWLPLLSPNSHLESAAVSPSPVPPTQSTSAAIGSKNNRTSSSKYTRHYSSNFRRHVITDQSTNTVVESFSWLQDALDRYPEATPLPVIDWRPSILCEKSYNRNSSSLSSSQTSQRARQLSPQTTPDNQSLFLLVAGAGWNETAAYPRIPPDPPDVNAAKIRTLLEERLHWFPSQVDRLIREGGCGWLFETLPAAIIQERLGFLLAPAPTNHAVLDQVNGTGVDWPVQFGRFGQGAGMSVAQVSHALQLIPRQLLRVGAVEYYEHRVLSGTPTTTTTENEPDADEDGRAHELPVQNKNDRKQAHFDIHSLAFLYTETPSEVLDMTRRILEGWLIGVPSVELAAFAHLHWRGWEWSQHRILLQALPDTASCALEPSWEIYERAGHKGGTYVRKELFPEAVWHMQCRLQLRPWHIHAMFKTHSRLTAYSVHQIQRNLDFLERDLGMTPVAVQRAVLKMPSLLGAAEDSLRLRRRFWTSRVGLTLPQLRKVVTAMPAVMQYSVSNNLEPKLDFFQSSLNMENERIAQMTFRKPTVWGRSLDRAIRPMMDGFRGICGMNTTEFGIVIQRAPELLLCNWGANLEPKMRFILEELCIKPPQLKSLLLSSPHMLMASNLQRKIDLIQKAVGHKETCSTLMQNPSLLLMSHSLLKDRILRAQAQSETTPSRSVVDALSSPNTCRVRTRRTVHVTRVATGEAVVSFDCVHDAAKYAGLSVSNMYHVVRTGRVFKGHVYNYGSSSSLDKEGGSPTDDNRSNSLNMKEEIFPQVEPPLDCPSETATPMSSVLTIYASGRSFPSEQEIRGRRRSGGLALRVPEWGVSEWRAASDALWKGRKLKLLPDGKTLILGYPYTSPSRRRCSLYVCGEAVRLARWWALERGGHSIEFRIFTDSNYVYDLLQDSDQIRHWGSVPTIKQFCYKGPGSTHEVNPDILYPLARSFFHLTGKTQTEDSSGPTTAALFLRTQDTIISKKVSDGAMLAATLTYKSTHL